MKTTTMYLPEAPDALIAETLTALLDQRIVEGLVGVDEAARHNDSAAYAMRVNCRLLLPDLNHGKDLLELRATVGWSGGELQAIRALLKLAAEHLRARADSVELEGTAVSLRRDADKADRLRHQWGER